MDNIPVQTLGNSIMLYGISQVFFQLITCCANKHHEWLHKNKGFIEIGYKLLLRGQRS